MEEIREQLKKAIQKLYGLDFEPEISPAPENIDADYSSNAPLKLAKELHKAPMEIGSEIKADIEDSSTTLTRARLHGASSLRTASEPSGTRSQNLNISLSLPGFINFIISDDYLTGQIDDLNQNFADYIKNNTFADRTVVCEFSDPNPFKVLHVGHLYTSIVGDSISRLFEYAGASVIRANFGGDVGLHVAKTMYALLQKETRDFTIEDIARCYVEGTAAYEDDEEAKAEITKLNKEIYRINAEKLHDTELAKLYWKGRDLSYQYFDNFYDSIGVKFDKYYPESIVANLGLQKVQEELEKGVYEVSDGAVIFNGEKYGLHTRVFINKEGVPTYETKDVGLIFTKWDDYHFDKSVVITGSEQLEYMKVVLKSVEQYAPELVKKTSHLTHGLVKLPGNEKMSSRKGNFLKAVDVLNMVREELQAEYDSSDSIVSLAATKYAFLKYKMGGNIIFDPKESVKMTGNSGPYLLYSAVRAKKILANARLKTSSFVRGLEPEESHTLDSRENRPVGEPLGVVRNIDSSDSNQNIIFTKEDALKPAERNLIKKVFEYKVVLNEAVDEMAPHKVANYLYELAQDFSRFYEACPVIGCDNEAERLKLVKVYLDIMMHGLNILGIEIPEEM